MDERNDRMRNVSVAGVLTSIRLSAWIGLFIALMLEILGRTNGLGYVLWRSWETFSAETFYAVMILVGLIAYLIWWVFDAIGLLSLRGVQVFNHGAGWHV